MLISEFIQHMDAIKDTHGDIDVLAFAINGDDECITAEPCFCLFKDEETDKVCQVVIGDESWADGADQEDDEDE